MEKNARKKIAAEQRHSLKQLWNGHASVVQWAPRGFVKQLSQDLHLVGAPILRVYFPQFCRQWEKNHGPLADLIKQNFDGTEFDLRPSHSLPLIYHRLLEACKNLDSSHGWKDLIVLETALALVGTQNHRPMPKAAEIKKIRSRILRSSDKSLVLHLGCAAIFTTTDLLDFYPQKSPKRAKLLSTKRLFLFHLAEMGEVSIQEI
jgi:hypothetical protein